MTHYLPMLLMFLAASSRTKQPAPRTPAEAPLKPIDPWAAAAKPKPTKKPDAIRTDPYAAKPAAKQPAIKPPANAEEAAAQAAVNAVIVDAIKRQVDTGVAMAQAPAAAKPALTIDVPKRSPQDAAVALRDFLRRTRKFGSKKSPVPEVKAAQADMGGLAVDGIVGPKTRARAKALGATLP